MYIVSYCASLFLLVINCKCKIMHCLLKIKKIVYYKRTKNIQAEVNAAPFLSVQVDETTDLTNKAQLSVILWYVYQSQAHSCQQGTQTCCCYWLRFNCAGLLQLHWKASRHTVCMMAMDKAFCCQRMSDTMAIVGRLREDFDAFYVRFQDKCQQLGLTDTLMRSDQPIRDWRSLLFHSILDNISTQMKTRFGHHAKLSFIGL